MKSEKILLHQAEDILEQEKGLIERQHTYNARLTALGRTICAVEALGFTPMMKAKI